MRSTYKEKLSTSLSYLCAEATHCIPRQGRGAPRSTALRSLQQTHAPGGCWLLVCPRHALADGRRHAEGQPLQFLRLRCRTRGCREGGGGGGGQGHAGSGGIHPPPSSWHQRSQGPPTVPTSIYRPRCEAHSSHTSIISRATCIEAGVDGALFVQHICYTNLPPHPTWTLVKQRLSNPILCFEAVMARTPWPACEWRRRPCATRLPPPP
jgi:hypothetical protein